jgi:uncharacterized protein YkwD
MSIARMVTRSSRLDALAAEHAKEQAIARRLSHEDRHGLSPDQRAAVAGLAKPSYLGEVMARGPRTPEEAIRAFQTSPAHCRTLMAPEATHVGIAIDSRGEGARPIWVIEFAAE